MSDTLQLVQGLPAHVDRIVTGAPWSGPVEIEAALTRGAVVLDIAPYVTLTPVATGVLVAVDLPGQQTRLLPRAGRWTVRLSDPGDVDAQAFDVWSGPFLCEPRTVGGVREVNITFPPIAYGQGAYGVGPFGGIL